MTGTKKLKSIHVASTAWFVLSVGYILVFALRQAGFQWWIIFSLSGHSVLIAFLLVSLYSFALFKGVSRNQLIEAEHPLTSTNYYMMFYVAIPFLGGLAGWAGRAGRLVTPCRRAYSSFSRKSSTSSSKLSSASSSKSSSMSSSSSSSS